MGSGRASASGRLQHRSGHGGGRERGEAVNFLAHAWLAGPHPADRLGGLMGDFIKGPLPDVPRVAGTAVYLLSDSDLVPSALFHNLKHYKVLHERIVFLHVANQDVPRIDDEERVEVTQLAPSIFSVEAKYGFREEPDVPAALALAARYDLELEPMTTTFFVARSNVVDGPGELPRWRCALFAWMVRQSEGAGSSFHLPANQVVELGTQVML